MLHSGCSFLFVKGPPDNHAKMATFDCSESRAWPVLDTIWAALNGLGAVSAASGSEMPRQNQQQGADRDTVMAVGFGWLVVSGAAAIFGYSQVSACNDAKHQRDERYFGQGVASPTPASRPVFPAAGGSTPAQAIVPAPTPSTAPATPAASSPAPALPSTAPAPATAPTPASRGSGAPAPTPSSAPSASAASPSGAMTPRVQLWFSAMRFAVPPPSHGSLTMR
jgi:hypothetical protein